MADDRSRVEKLIGMLGSDHDGEIVNAARLLRRMAEKDGKTLPSLLMTGATQTVYVEKIVYRDPPYSPPRGGVADEAMRRARESFDERERAQYEAGRAYRREHARANASGLYAQILAILDLPHLTAHLDAWSVDFLRDLSDRVTHDHEMTWRQRDFVKKCIRKINKAEQRRNAEPLI